MLTSLYILRHAQAQPVRGTAEPDWALSPRGEQQAGELASVLRTLGITQAYSSPFRRCRDTIAPFTRATGLPLQVHDGLRERCLSRQWIGDFREIWRRSWEDLSFALPDGESSLVCRDRMAASVDHLARRHAGETLVLASHGFAIGLLLTTIDPGFGGLQAGALRTPELLKLTHDGHRLEWDRTFTPGAVFDGIATEFRSTPGIVAQRVPWIQTHRRPQENRANCSRLSSQRAAGPGRWGKCIPWPYCL